MTGARNRLDPVSPGRILKQEFMEPLGLSGLHGEQRRRSEQGERMAHVRVLAKIIQA